MWDKSEHEYIKAYDFIDFSEELLGVTRDEGEAQVISWLENKEIRVRLHINFKGYTLIDQAENTPYQIYNQCNYIHAWVALLGFAKRNLLRRLKNKTSDLNLDYVTTGRGFIDKIMTSKPIATKYFPQELEPIDPIELKEKQKIALGLDKPFSNDFSMILNTTARTELKNLYFKKDELLKIFSPSGIEENRDQQIIRLSGENKALKYEKERRDERIASLENQLAQAELADKPTDSITQSNTDIHNIKKEAIKQFNRSLATVLIDLDYKDKLRKSDIANYIVPYMKELAFVLADEQQDKANNLTVTYDTLYDNHLKNLGFKQGRQSDDEKQKVNIDLLFKKQLPTTE